jgi:hypothetical protein
VWNVCETAQEEKASQIKPRPGMAATTTAPCMRHDEQPMARLARGAEALNHLQCCLCESGSERAENSNTWANMLAGRLFLQNRNHTELVGVP